MTGYAVREIHHQQFYAQLEIKTCNNRYLDISVHLPAALNSLEQEIRKRVSSKVSRGRVDAAVRYRPLESEGAIHVDRSGVLQYLRAFQEIQNTAGLSGEVTLQDFLAVGEMLKPVESYNVSEHGGVLLDEFEGLLDELNQTRRVEGAAVRKDIEGQLEGFTQLFSYVRGRSADLEQQLKKQLKERFEELTNGSYDENRVLSEVAVMLVKYSIHEELQRTESHLEQFARYLDQTEPIGKKLDFLCQELNREINTIASKSTIAEVNQHVVEMKDHVENIREQLRNVE